MISTPLPSTSTQNSSVTKKAKQKVKGIETKQSPISNKQTEQENITSYSSILTTPFGTITTSQALKTPSGATPTSPALTTPSEITATSQVLTTLRNASPSLVLTTPFGTTATSPALTTPSETTATSQVLTTPRTTPTFLALTTPFGTTATSPALTAHGTIAINTKSTKAPVIVSSSPPTSSASPVTAKITQIELPKHVPTPTTTPIMLKLNTSPEETINPSRNTLISTEITSISSPFTFPTPQKPVPEPFVAKSKTKFSANARGYFLPVK
ncbi:mucin-7-like [Palaemon carinicauda]|uniref:mucin-7-like n=1 Tax=Palaemon carinicauda TaxID=392227 RepID=UPI0035B5D721